MRPLNDYFVGLGNMGNLSVLNNASDWAMASFAGEVMGFYYNATAAVTGDSASVKVQWTSGALMILTDAGVLPITPINTGGFVPITGGRIFIGDNAKIRVLSDGIPAAGAVELTAVIRSDTRDLNLIQYELGDFVLDDAGTDSQNVCTPSDSRVVGFSWNAQATVTDEFSATVHVNGSATTTTVTFPAAAQFSSGFSHCSSQLFIKPGERVKLDSGGEGTAGTVTLAAVMAR